MCEASERAADFPPLHRMAAPLTGKHIIPCVGANNYSPNLQWCCTRQLWAKDFSPLQGIECIHVTLSGVERDMGRNYCSSYVRVDKVKPSP